MLPVRNLPLLLPALLAAVIFSGCVTTHVEYVENDKLPKNKVYRIADVFMKDGSIINLRGTEPKFKAEYKGKTSVIIYYDEDYKRKYIELANVRQVKIEIYEGDILGTVLIIVGSLAVLTVILLIMTIHSIGNITG